MRKLSLAIMIMASICLGFSTYLSANEQTDLVSQIKEVKPSIVGIALYSPIDSPTPGLLGTGFVVGNGKYVATNYHVVSKELDPTIVQYFVALSGEGSKPKIHRMTLIGRDPVHDLALFSIKQSLKPMRLADDEFYEAGTSVAITGFPLGAVLGLYPATHTGIIATLAPDINPAKNADQLTVDMLNRLKKPFMIYQLDLTAFPGNSGSPMYSRTDGKVVGVVNKVFVSQGKEAALTNPSGISYAIPIKHLRALAAKHNVEL